MDRRRMMSTAGFMVFVVDGNGSSTNKESYVEHNGTRYTVGEKFRCNANDVITCYLYGNWDGCRILFEGQIVAEDVNPVYSFAVKSDITVTVEFEPYGNAKMYIAAGKENK